MLTGAWTVFVSGAAVMVSELIAARLVAPFYGQSSATWAALAGVTLLGVTLGNYLGGILSQRLRRPLRVAAFGALLGGVLLALLPALLPLFARLTPPDNGGLFLFALLAFLPPTACLGLVSPAIGAAFVRPDHNGRDLGVLYFASMIGCTLGSALGGLVLPFTLSTPVICCLCAVVLAALGLMLFRLKGQQRGAGTPAAPRFVLPPVRLLAQVFLLGFLGMALELYLARLVTPVFGGSHIVWSTIFITFIGWMGVGGFVGGRVADRWGRRIPAWTIYLALFVVLYLTVLLETRGFGYTTMAWHPAVRLLVQLFLGFAPMAFTLGLASAFLLQQATAASLAAGDRSAIGLVYAVNGIGSSCGSFFAGMLFVGAASALAALPGATRPLPVEIQLAPDQRVLFRGESSYNSVTVTESGGTGYTRTIWLDRTPHTTIDMRNPATLNASYTRLLDCAMTVYAPPVDRRVFVIGGGGYALPRKWDAEKGVYAEVQVAEIDPLVSFCAHRFLDAPDDNDVMHDHIADGRRLAMDFIRAGDTNRFDVVIGDTIGDAAIPYHLTTEAFDRQIREHLLKPQGVYLMHVLDRLDDPGILSAVMTTLGRVFPRVTAVSYGAMRDVRQSFCVIAGDYTPDSVARYVDEIVRRYPEAQPLVIEAGDLPSGQLLTDAFAPVERYVWRVMCRDVQYRPYQLAQEARAALVAQDEARAYALACAALQLQPGQTDALDVLSFLDKGEDLKLQAEHPSVSPEPLLRYGVYLMKKGRRDEARPVWAELCRRWPENGEYRKTLEALSK